ncbi:MAG TPA: type II toxin-antitoxin system VapC family toxin [Tepidisphaeraceae bacterium]|jgi:tRNA(fMet)-specific endonuclease VapC|nr:type II toxin-antitoxin system VapC family toxin [Tepidisphaeraceae bacterium]
MIILDTDVFSLLELPDSREFARLRARIAQLDPPVPVTTSVITYEEQSRGRLASVSRARNDQQLVGAYAHLQQHVLNYRKVPMVEFCKAAAAAFGDLQRSKIRLGTMDLRIAAIALSRNALLITRNLRDFQKVPGLRVEDWTKP